MKLRARGQRKSYAEAFAPLYDAESDAPAEVRDGDSGSDFEPAAAAAEEADADAPEPEDDDDDDELELDDEEDGDSVRDAAPMTSSRYTKGSRSSRSKATQRPITGLPTAVSLARVRGLKPSGPTASAFANHRFRPWSTFRRDGRVLRLAVRPEPFQPPSTTLSNPIMAESLITRRLNRLLANNVGPGPLWELLEDCAWWKESKEPPDGNWTEAFLRPTVHKELKLSTESWDILSPEESFRYLPHAEGSPGIIPPPVRCSFGPFEAQKTVDMGILDTLNMSDFYPDSRAVVFNAGGSVLGLDWCPLSPDAFVQESARYLAAAPLPSKDYHLGIGSKRPSAACIQIWRLSPRQRGSASLSVRCALIICAEYGPAVQVKWCPLPCNDGPVNNDPAHAAKLGLLAGTFADGSFTVFAVPDPNAFEDASGPVPVLAKRPLARLSLNETACWCFDWANSDTVAVGCTNGSVAVVKLGAALRNRQGDETAVLVPTHYFSVHQSAVRSLCWIRLPRGTKPDEIKADPTALLTGGYDGRVTFTDIRDQRPALINRSRDAVMDMCFSPHVGVPLTLDFGNTVKFYCVLPLLLGRGQTLLDCDGPVWSVAASDYHPQLAVGTADGRCTTTNIARSSKRGSSAPFFIQKIFQLDYSRKTGVFRMLDQFLPKVRLVRKGVTGGEDEEEAQPANENEGENANANPDDEVQEQPAKKSKKKKDKMFTAEIPEGPNRATGSWPKEVSVTCVVWDSGGGISSAPFLAAATASGLCRIDWLLGQFYTSKYDVSSVDAIRQGATGGIVDDDDEEEE
ncbi:hypothetical protein AURDEDRAFT_180776 [Auricularia subglabra TFB-10046 SS5]|nr:hypothetical protein AURDEDRAFT_180776 [Auricularia subglabra TFB-10046 SS5]